MKFVYIIEIGQLSKLENKFNFYDMEVFPSQKAADHVVKNMIECNTSGDFEELVKQGDVRIEKSEEGGFKRGEVSHTVYTYNCMGSGFNNVPTKMTVRYVVRKMLVNRNF